MCMLKKLTNLHDSQLHRWLFDKFAFFAIESQTVTGKKRKLLAKQAEIKDWVPTNAWW